MARSRYYAPTAGPRGETIAKPTRVGSTPAARPTEAFRGGTHDAYGQTGLSAVTRLSVLRHEVDPLRVFKHLFGKEAVYDEHTGIVVYAGPRRV